MSHCRATLLADRGVLRVTGADAHKLLQGVITNNLDKAQGGAAIHAGLLSPQGKILFDFFVAADGDGFLIEAAKDRLAELAKRLGIYRLRAQVEIAEAPEFTVAAAWGGAPNIPEGAIAFADPRLAELGVRILLPAGASVADLGCAQAGEADYHALRIKLGVPESGRDYGLGDTFPHEALFDQLNGVDFKKGCFVGQEVVARMQHRGTTRTRVVPVEGDAPLTTGVEVKAGELPIGPIGSVDGAVGLALLRLDRAEEAASKGTPLTAGDVTITLHRPAFAQFDVPAALPA
ncbi:MAG: folate-binding protein [Hyphomicrobiales bacterium]|nr:MAG: folate-binding protein [Hyphomicrobiales bacterium]